MTDSNRIHSETTAAAQPKRIVDRADATDDERRRRSKYEEEAPAKTNLPSPLDLGLSKNIPTFKADIDTSKAPPSSSSQESYSETSEKTTTPVRSEKSIAAKKPSSKAKSETKVDLPKEKSTTSKESKEVSEKKESKPIEEKKPIATEVKNEVKKENPVENAPQIQESTPILKSLEVEKPKEVAITYRTIPLPSSVKELIHSMVSSIALLKTNESVVTTITLGGLKEGSVFQGAQLEITESSIGGNLSITLRLAPEAKAFMEKPSLPFVSDKIKVRSMQEEMWRSLLQSDKFKVDSLKIVSLNPHALAIKEEKTVVFTRREYTTEEEKALAQQDKEKQDDEENKE